MSANAVKLSWSDILSNPFSYPANLSILYLWLLGSASASFVDAEDFERSFIGGACSAIEELPLPASVAWTQQYDALFLASLSGGLATMVLCECTTWSRLVVFVAGERCWLAKGQI